MIHESLKSYLQEKRGRGKQLAADLGVSVGYVSMLKKGQRRPSPELAQKIESLTGIPFRQLLLFNTPASSSLQIPAGALEDLCDN